MVVSTNNPAFDETTWEELPYRLEADYANKGTLVSMFVSDDTEISGSLKGYYTMLLPAENAAGSHFITYIIKIKNNELPSFAGDYPVLNVFERESADLFGLKLVNSPDTRSITNLDTASTSRYPMLKSYYKGDRLSFVEDYDYTEISGNDAYILPVGPIHAGIIEAGMFRFTIVGEHVFNVDSRLFYKHRGIEKLFEGLRPEQGVYLAEKVSGNSSVSHTISYCSAIESLYNMKLPIRAKYLRMLYAEMERLYNLAHNLAHICAGTGLVYGNFHGAGLREKLMGWNEKLTGSRFLFGVNIIGGVKKDIAAKTLKELGLFMDSFRKEISDFIRMQHEDMIHMDRLNGCGRLKNDTARILGARGYAAKASGIDFDTRKDIPYLLYDELQINIKTENAGDAHARVVVMESEIDNSISLIKKLSSILTNMDNNDIISQDKMVAGSLSSYGIGMGASEGPRGMNMYTVIMDKEGKNIHRCKITPASLLNWQLVSHAMLGNIVPDFPLVNKSFNLSFSAHDR